MPRVGLTVSYEKYPDDPTDIARIEKYLACIRAAGAEAETLFLGDWANRSQEAVKWFDGFVVSGGADLDPSWYGQAEIPEAGLEMVNDRRPAFEKALLTEAVAAGKPVFGICYGCQFLNVFRGGQLIQDINLQIPGTGEHRGGVVHSVKVDKDSQLFEITGLDEFDVPSFHHQSISEPPPGGKITAYSPDGVVEAIEWDGPSFFLGVQWHPERDPDSQATRRLFEAFVSACRS